MKIGILTFWWSQDNYGQLLQCYALHKYLTDLGHDSFIINYNNTKELSNINKKALIKKIYKIYKIFNIKKLVAIFSEIKTNRKISVERKINNRNFDLFRNSYLRFSDCRYDSYEQLKLNPPEADLYIVGSDQVWNFNVYNSKSISKMINVYFLNFGIPEIKKISYAASWSMSYLSKDLQNRISPLINNFSFVSVREKSGIDLCVQCGYKNAVWVPDPTLLNSLDIYRSLYDKECISKGYKYIFLYLLNNPFNFDIDKIYQFAKDNNLEVLYVTGNGLLDEREKKYLSIPQWLFYIENAEYVITNSFHCALFSTIFHKQYAVIPGAEKIVGMNERFVSLFELFKIEDRYLDEDFSVLKKEYLYDYKPYHTFLSDYLTK